jgi:hypothetical protein
MLDNADVHIIGAESGKPMLELNWHNAWGGNSGSEADQFRRRTSTQTAEDIADTRID